MSAAGRPGHRSWLLLPATTLLLAGLAAGCSSSKPAYCKAGDQLKTSLQGRVARGNRTPGLPQIPA